MIKSMEQPILFGADMVRAILAGVKTETRRVIKSLQDEKSKEYKNIKCRYGVPGNKLWVRETFTNLDLYERGYELNPPILFGYKADLTAKDVVSNYYLDTTGWNWTHPHIRWKPGTFLPKAAARIWLEITETTLCRLQTMNEADAIKEGMQTSLDKSAASALLKYRKVWDKINPEYNWGSNPLVWVIKFKKIDK